VKTLSRHIVRGGFRRRKYMFKSDRHLSAKKGQQANTEQQFSSASARSTEGH